MSPQKTILITGGSGFIGTELTKRLLALHYVVLVIDTVPPKIENKNLSFLKIDLTQETLPQSYDSTIHAVVHLAGKNIFGRWSSGFKNGLYMSRIKSAESLITSFSSWKEKPKVFVSASAFGFYGNKNENVVTEEDVAGDDYGAKLCLAWENEVKKAKDLSIRTISIRTGNVLGNGGLLSPLYIPFKYKLGFYLGKGNGWFPWIHIDDIVSLYIYVIEHDFISGQINAASPDYVTQKEFMTVYGKVMKTWIMVSIPIALLSLRFGEFAYSFLNSVKMSSEKIRSLGFVFTYTNLEEALTEIIVTKSSKK